MAYKLTPSQVSDIRKILKDDDLPISHIAKLFGVCDGTIHLIAKGKTWIPKPSFEERFNSRLIRTPAGCLEWQGCKMPSGHGQIRIGGRKGKTYLVHRIAWCLHLKIDPETLKDCVCHRCDNPPCCDPAHLFPGTLADNVADMISKKRNKAARGEEKPNSKLSNSRVVEIRLRFEEGESVTKLSKRFGIDTSGISRLIRRQSWKHVL